MSPKEPYETPENPYLGKQDEQMIECYEKWPLELPGF